MAKKIKWRCYVCGERIKTLFFLYSLNDNTDRVFLVCENRECVRRLPKKEGDLMAVSRNERE